MSEEEGNAKSRFAISPYLISIQHACNTLPSPILPFGLVLALSFNPTMLIEIAVYNKNHNLQLKKSYLLETILNPVIWKLKSICAEKLNPEPKTSWTTLHVFRLLASGLRHKAKLLGPVFTWPFKLKSRSVNVFIANCYGATYRDTIRTSMRWRWP